MRASIQAIVVLVAVAGSTLALPAHASRIFLAGDSNIFTTAQDNEVLFQNIFDGQSVANYSSRSLSGLGTTATETSFGSGAAITASGLAGQDYMIFGFNRTSVSASELTAITDFYNAGGSLFLFGEGNATFVSVNNTVNSVLAAVGSTMSLSTTENFDDGGFTTLSSFVGTGPFASGVSSWTTALTARIDIGSGQSVISGVADAGFFGVAIGLEAASVPEPGGLALLVLGLAGLGWTRRGDRPE